MSSIYKVAELAGVSVATVSRAINNSGYVSPKTRLKVEEAMKALHYTINMAAQSLTTERTNLIGLLVPDIKNPVYLSQAEGINDFLKDKGINLIYAESGDTDEEIATMVRRFLSNRVDGIILCSRDFSQLNNMDEIIELALKNDVNVVLNGSMESGFAVDKVSFDSQKGAYLATKHLLRLGHTRIGLISGSECLITKERHNGYHQALVEYGVPLNEELIVYGDYRQHSGFMAMKRLIELPDRPTAVFAMNDVMAIGAMIALEEANIAIPEEMAVVGFDDIIWCSIIRPRLSSVVQPKYEIGHKLAEMLYSRITKQYTGPGRHHVFSPRLAVRQSTTTVTAVQRKK
jgi:DNA-binding LacI/PurR family transcriptional regulator